MEKGFASGNADELIAQTEGIEIGEATIDGDTATVATTSSEGVEGETPLIKEDDEWKVDFE